MAVIRGSIETIQQFNDAILKYLFVNPQVNQRAIETLERIKKAPNDNFSFLLDCDETGTVNGFSYKFNVYPVLFTANFDQVSQEYLNSVLSLGTSIQGAVEDLDRLFASLPSAPQYTVEKDMTLMVCTPETFVREHFLDPCFIIRESNDSDISVLTEMIGEFVAAVAMDAGSFSSVENLLSRGSILVAVETETNRVAACVYVTTAQSFSRISLVYTRPDFRRKGLSKVLVAKAIDSLGSSATCTLFVNTLNVAARASYTAVGFRPLSTNQVRKIL